MGKSSRGSGGDIVCFSSSHLVFNSNDQNAICTKMKLGSIGEFGENLEQNEAALKIINLLYSTSSYQPIIANKFISTLYVI